ncbi:hypothetical protein CV102_04765 [Natronococcus pandeyae]|uniref:Uncharacterized protein n=1 Tax=Natronococcus pandeyae TaxID=2055836 RepID=A0A8J8TR61_9EURY|nr:hypothetical protein CV102_04765 [Natronococcus pandeyae]
MSQNDNWLKAAAKCCECGAVYSAWILPDDSVQLIGRKDGCRCGASAFREISSATHDDPSVSETDGA